MKRSHRMKMWVLFVLLAVTVPGAESFGVSGQSVYREPDSGGSSAQSATQGPASTSASTEDATFKVVSVNSLFAERYSTLRVSDHELVDIVSAKAPPAKDRAEIRQYLETTYKLGNGELTDATDAMARADKAIVAWRKGITEIAKNPDDLLRFARATDTILLEQLRMEAVFRNHADAPVNAALDPSPRQAIENFREQLEYVTGNGE